MNTALRQHRKPCGQCAHFRLGDSARVLGVCTKKLMAVTSTLHACYNKQTGGPCFTNLKNPLLK